MAVHCYTIRAAAETSSERGPAVASFALHCGMLRIATPCNQAWDAMEPRGEDRFCEACGKGVHDLTHVTERRALALAAVFGSGGMCGRLRTDAGGAPIFAPEPAPPRRPNRGLPLVLVAAAAAAMGGCTPAAPSAPPAPYAPPAPSAVVATAPRAAVAAAMNEQAPVSLADADGDGIPDDVDACPNHSGPASADPAKNGCTMVVVTTTGDLIIPSRITFAFGATAVVGQSADIVDETANVLTAHPEIKAVEIAGHASNDEPKAKALSMARAQAVVALLVQRGIAAQRLVPVGVGDEKPLVPNDSKDHRAQNRRIELRIVEQPGGTST
jgi:outer membrane protein OmpA-like peptidoglycan-associated protein